MDVYLINFFTSIFHYILLFGLFFVLWSPYVTSPSPKFVSQMEFCSTKL